ncbi:MAG: 16S rRNA (cytidine(1402)-2'-O)-methyltransferase [Clostridia bacterium]|nr:16S rRNA (cytidine(1402)-2'-O)-methyltransferase [Clostridia bacterium]
MSGTLYVVGTPIGNLGDISPRALKTLEMCDFIAAEDTRVTLKLLNHFEIKKPLVSYFEHNKTQRGEEIVQRILGGETCAIVTDAGMPAISDPGQELVAQCHDANIDVKVVPGPCAFVSALAVCGLSTGRFTFEGFLSTNKLSRREHLKSLVGEKRTMVFYEAPHKLSATLIDLYAALGDRNLVIVREITKIYEQVIRTTLEQAAQDYANCKLKGEIVLVIEGAAANCEDSPTLENAFELAQAMVNGGMSINEASKLSAKQTGIKKSDIYKLLQE